MPDASSRPPVVLISPNVWDRAQIPPLIDASRLPYKVQSYGPDLEHSLEVLDADAFIRRAVDDLSAMKVRGVTSSSDYPGCLLASFVAQELGLPGPDPRSLLLCSHKYYARLAQSAAVPEATPQFRLLNPRATPFRDFDLPFPVFVKPVKSWFSQFARRVESFEEMRAFLTSPGVATHLRDFVRPMNQLLARYPDFEVDAGYMLAEEVLTGQQVTLEGLVTQGRVIVVGIVDSVMYARSNSFEHFDYPSSLAPEVAERMRLLSERAMSHVGFDQGLFNVEFIYDSVADSIGIVEINPRMCGQFADLMGAVNGTNTYELLFALAVGATIPPVRPGGTHRLGTSYVLRHFQDAVVVRAPDLTTVAERAGPASVTLVSAFYGDGDRLSDNDFESDGYSYRYAVVNVVADSPETLAEHLTIARNALTFDFAAA